MKYPCCSPGCTNTCRTPGWCEDCLPVDSWFGGPAGHAPGQWWRLRPTEAPTALALPTKKDQEALTDHNYTRVPVY
jgi:hypothetical protein